MGTVQRVFAFSSVQLGSIPAQEESMRKILPLPWRFRASVHSLQTHKPSDGATTGSSLDASRVSFIGKDRDSIRVGRSEGRFKAIRLEARNNDVEVLDLKVVYSNGAPDDIQVRSNIRAGSRTRPLDLKGRERAIQRIELVYRSRPSFKGLATVCAEGLD